MGTASFRLLTLADGHGHQANSRHRAGGNATTFVLFSSYLPNTALQPALRFDLFLIMQAVTAGMLGISLEQRRNASGVQAARCCAVASAAWPAPIMAINESVTPMTMPDARCPVDGNDRIHALVPVVWRCQRRCLCRGECSRSGDATVTGITRINGSASGANEQGTSCRNVTSSAWKQGLSPAAGQWHSARRKHRG